MPHGGSAAIPRMDRGDIGAQRAATPRSAARRNEQVQPFTCWASPLQKKFRDQTDTRSLDRFHERDTETRADGRFPDVT